jgi:hypothetical protein
MTKERHVTTVNIGEPIQAQAPVKPEWIRLPLPGHTCPWSGLKRSKLNELILPSEINGHKPPVKSICVRNKGQKKGVRLISFDSLMAYLNSMVESDGRAA